MKESVEHKLDAKKVFKECETCSRTFGHILNCEFGHPQSLPESALNPLAGGIMNQGHQCGMLWGSALAAGAEAYRRQNDLEKAIAITITATQHIIDSFVKRTKTVNCKEIIGYNLSTVYGMTAYMIKTIIQGMNNSDCFNLAEKWAPEAVQAATEGLNDTSIELTETPNSCASLVAKKLGATNEETAMVAGFAGGLGLRGNGCGALSAAIWMKMLQWSKDNPGKKPPFFNNPEAKKILIAFKEKTGGEMLCNKITGRTFGNVNEHSSFINSGGCKELITVLSSNN